MARGTSAEPAAAPPERAARQRFARWCGAIACQAVQPWDDVRIPVVSPRHGACQTCVMIVDARMMNRRLVAALHVEAMLLADEARSYFDRDGRIDRDALAPELRVAFSCESLRATTRLMHVVAWLLAWRAMDAGEIGSGERELRAHRLAGSDRSDPELVAALPEAARRIVAMTLDLHSRVARLDAEMGRAAPSVSPAHGLVDRLRAAF